MWIDYLFHGEFVVEMWCKWKAGKEEENVIDEVESIGIRHKFNKTWK